MNPTDLSFGEFIIALAVWVVAMVATWNYGSDVHHHQHHWLPFVCAVLAGPAYLLLVHLHRKLF